MTDYESIKKVSRGKFSYSKFLKLKELAQNTIGVENDIYTFQLTGVLTLISTLDEQISLIEAKKLWTCLNLNAILLKVLV